MTMFEGTSVKQFIFCLYFDKNPYVNMVSIIDDGKRAKARLELFKESEWYLDTHDGYSLLDCPKLE